VGGYSDWLRQRKVAAPEPAAPEVVAPAVVAPAVVAPVVVAPGVVAPGAVLAQPRARRLSYKDQRELAAMPEKIQVLEAEQLRLQAAIADPNLFKADPARGTAALQRLQSLAAELENAYSRWDALES
jgi:ATP-binding cassette subfamily F protein uup